MRLFLLLGTVMVVGAALPPLAAEAASVCWYVTCAATSGDATCFPLWLSPCVAVTGSGNSRGTIAVAGGGEANATLLAVGVGGSVACSAWPCIAIAEGGSSERGYCVTVSGLLTDSTEVLCVGV